jgi:uncharacterized membrane protein
MARRTQAAVTAAGLAFGLLLVGGTSIAEEASPPAKVETDSYTVSISLDGPCKQGAACNAKVTLTAKGDYHVNGRYPNRFKTPEPAKVPDGLSYPTPLVGEKKPDSEKTLTLLVPFVTKVSHVSVGGTLFFGVCTETHCDNPHVAVAVHVDAKAP